MTTTIRNNMRPVSPGEILQEQLDALDMSANQLAHHLNVPGNRISRLLAGTTAVTPDTALRLARFFDTTPTFWMNLQMTFALRKAEIKASDSGEYEAIVPLAKSA